MVEFNVSGSGVLTVDSDTLYVDNGNSSDGYYDQTMGVYLDMGLGLSSALIPSSNTVTTPAASNIVDSGSNALSLDNLRTEDAIFAHYDTEPNFNWTNAIALDINIDQAVLTSAMDEAGMSSAQCKFFMIL